MLGGCVKRKQKWNAAICKLFTDNSFFKKKKFLNLCSVCLSNHLLFKDMNLIRSSASEHSADLLVFCFPLQLLGTCQWHQIRSQNAYIGYWLGFIQLFWQVVYTVLCFQITSRVYDEDSSSTTRTVWSKVPSFFCHFQKCWNVALLWSSGGFLMKRLCICSESLMSDLFILFNLFCNMQRNVCYFSGWVFVGFETLGSCLLFPSLHCNFSASFSVKYYWSHCNPLWRLKVLCIVMYKTVILMVDICVNQPC